MNDKDTRKVSIDMVMASELGFEKVGIFYLLRTICLYLSCTVCLYPYIKGNMGKKIANFSRENKKETWA